MTQEKEYIPFKSWIIEEKEMLLKLIAKNKKRINYKKGDLRRWNKHSANILIETIFPIINSQIDFYNKLLEEWEEINENV